MQAVLEKRKLNGSSRAVVETEEILREMWIILTVDKDMLRYLLHK